MISVFGHLTKNPVLKYQPSDSQNLQLKIIITEKASIINLIHFKPVFPITFWLIGDCPDFF